MSYWKRFVLFGVWILFCSYFFHVLYTDARTKAIKELNARQLIHAKQAAAGIEALIDHWMTFLAVAARKDSIIDLDEHGKEHIRFTLIAHKNDISAVTRVDRNGAILYTAPHNEKAVGANLMHQAHIQKLFKTKKPTVSDVFRATQGYSAVAIHFPVFKGGEFAGSIGILLDFEIISKRFLEVIRLGETGYAWMISAAGVELYCPVPGHVGNTVFSNCEAFPTIISMAEKMVKGQQGITEYRFDSIKERKVKTLKKHAVYMPIQIGNTFWSIVAASSEEEVLASLKGFKDKLLLLVFILLAGSMLFAYFSIRAWTVLKEEEKRRSTEDALRESEKRYRILFEEAPISLWEQDFSAVKNRLDALREQNPADLKGYFEARPELVKELAGLVNIIDVNKATLNLYKAESKADLFHGLPEVFPEEAYDDFMTCLVGISKGEKVFYFEKIHKTLEKETIAVQLHWMVAPDFEETYGRVIVSIIDITDLKKTTDALQESEEKYRTMMEGMRQPVYICSADYVIEYMNPAMIHRIGRDAAGESCFAALHDRESKCPCCFHERVTAGESVEREIVSPKDNRHYRVSGTPIFHTDGTTSKMAIYQDITDFVRAVRMKEAAENQLRQSQKMEAIGTLSGGIAHDFNNILFPIIGYAEMTLDALPPDENNRKNIEEILRAANRAKELIKHILTFSRKSAKQMKPLLVQPIIKESLKLLRSTIPTSIEIVQHIHDADAVVADPTQIHQIMMNLCTNAYHAMQNTNGVLQVAVAESDIPLEMFETIPDAKPGKYVMISVRDTGMGMDQQMIERIFEPYYTTKDKDKGTGLGLAVVHGIVKEHNGFITVDSEVGRGSVFKVFLPALQMEKKEDAQVEDGESPMGSESVLFVDDDEYIANMAEQMLVRLGYKATLRYSSLDALALFRNRPDDFDIVITDMTMPNMTGDQLAGEIKKIRPEIPIILSTGYSESIDSDKARELGFSAFLMKPILKKELAVAVRNALDKDPD